MLRLIPIIAVVVIRLEPPYERKGKVTPVTGRRPVTTPILIKAWTKIRVVKPNRIFLENISSHFIAP